MFVKCHTIFSSVPSGPLFRGCTQHSSRACLTILSWSILTTWPNNRNRILCSEETWLYTQGLRMPQLCTLSRSLTPKTFCENRISAICTWDSTLLFRSLPRFVIIDQGRNRCRFKNWLLCCDWKLSFVTTEGKPNVMLWFLYQYVYHLLVLSSVTREYHSGYLNFSTCFNVLLLTLSVHITLCLCTVVYRSWRWKCTHKSFDLPKIWVKTLRHFNNIDEIILLC